MPSIGFANASQLSYCGVSPPLFERLVTDQLFDRLPIREIATQCEKRVLIADSDKPVFDYIPSGGLLTSDPVTWQADTDIAVKRTGAYSQYDGDFVNVDLEAIFKAQVTLISTLIKQMVSQQLFTLAPGAETPRTVPSFAASNPAGVMAVGGELTLDHLACLRQYISPWTSATPLAYVMHSQTFERLERSARQQGTPIEYLRDEDGSRIRPYFGSFEILLNDFISLEETDDTTSIYLMRLGSAEDDPAGIRGVSLIVPPGGRGIHVSPLERLSDGSDMLQAAVYWDVGFDGGSPGAAIARATGITT